MGNTYSSEELLQVYVPASLVERERQRLEEDNEPERAAMEIEYAERKEVLEVAKLNRRRNKLAKLNRESDKFARLKRQINDDARRIRIRRENRRFADWEQSDIRVKDYEKRKRELVRYMMKKRSIEEERVAELLIQKFEEKLINRKKWMAGG